MSWALCCFSDGPIDGDPFPNGMYLFFPSTTSDDSFFFTCSVEAEHPALDSTKTPDQDISTSKVVPVVRYLTLLTSPLVLFPCRCPIQNIPGPCVLRKPRLLHLWLGVPLLCVLPVAKSLPSGRHEAVHVLSE